MNLTEHLSSLQLLCSYRPLPEFCVVLLLLQSKTFSICYNKSFNLMWHLTIQNWEDILGDIISPIVSYLEILNNKIANRNEQGFSPLLSPTSQSSYIFCSILLISISIYIHFDRIKYLTVEGCPRIWTGCDIPTGPPEARRGKGTYCCR